MKKRGRLSGYCSHSLLFLSILLFVFIFSFYYASAAENNTVAEQTSQTPAENNTEIRDNTELPASENISYIPDKFANETLERGAGITPDSIFYFIEDSILSKFRSDSANREKKIAEFREMVREGKIEDAKKSIEKYKEYAENFEKEVSPDKREEAQKSAAAIRNAVVEVEKEIPSEERREIIDDVVNQESRISRAAEIASKIKELCETLSIMDPGQYARVCKTDNDENAPRWQRELDSKLTKEQRKEAEEFFNIMSQCYENPKECQCSKIKIEKFAALCNEKAPLAAKCEEGDKVSCEELNSGEDPRDILPDYLQPVLDKVERRFSKAEFDNFAPPECQKAGAKSPQECMKIMFIEHAPDECRKAVEEGKIKFDNGREAEKACQEIMFKANAPLECVEANIRDPKECGKLMFQKNAPEECRQAGLTGESGSDPRKCEEIMKNIRNDKQGPRVVGVGKDCRGLQDREERLKCFDEMFNNVQQQYEGRDNFREGPRYEQRPNIPEGSWPEQCRRANAFEPDACRKVMESEGQRMRQEGEQTQGYQYQPPQQYQPQYPQQQCPPGQPCQQPPVPEQQCPPGQPCPAPYQQPYQQSPAPAGTGTEQGIAPSGETTTSSSTSSTTTPSTSTETSSGSSETTTSSSSSQTSSGSGTSSGEVSSSIPASSSEGGGAAVTGSVIGDNGFLKYYFGQ